MLVLEPQLGNWVVGPSFWARNRELKQIRHLLRQGQHISVLAPRRMGKSSLLREAGQRFGQQLCVLQVDLQAGSDARQLCVEIAKSSWARPSLRAAVRSVFANSFTNEPSNVAELEAQVRDGLAGEWQPKATRLVAEIAALELDVVVFVDELSLFVEQLVQSGTPRGREHANALLTWLASTMKEQRVLFVVAGSSALDELPRPTVTARLPFHEIDLEPWDHATVVSCVRALAAWRELQLDDSVLQYIGSLLGEASPYHVQLFWKELFDDMQHRGAADIGLPDVERVYQVKMLNERIPVDFMLALKRLDHLFDRKDAELAHALLREAARSGGELVDAQIAALIPCAPQDLELRKRLSDTLRRLVAARYFVDDPERQVYRLRSRYFTNWITRQLRAG